LTAVRRRSPLKFDNFASLRRPRCRWRSRLAWST
jgi:hypothetical protein